MRRQATRFLFWFSASALAMIAFALGPVAAGEISLSDSTAAPEYAGVVAFCFAALVTFGAPAE